MRQITDPVTRKSGPPELRRRLILALSIPLMLILCISLLLDYRLARETSDLAYDQGLSETVFDLESHISNRQASPVLDMTEESEVMLRTNAPDKVYFSIRDNFNRILTGDDDIPVLSMPKGNGIKFFDGTHRGRTYVSRCIGSSCLTPKSSLLSWKRQRNGSNQGNGF